MDYCLLAAALAAAALPALAVPLINPGETFRYRKGTSPPQNDWRTAADAGLDASWLTGPGFIGYGDGTPGTALADMRRPSGATSGGYLSVYVRKSFTVPAEVPATDRIVLTTDYDDGFIAWITPAGGAPSFVDSDNVSGSPAEPAFDDEASDLHECSFGNSSPQAARSTDLGAAGTVLPPGDYILSVILLNEENTSSDAILQLTLATEPAGTGGSTLSGTIPTSTTLTAANSPYSVTGNVTVPAGVTLTIEPGVTLRMNNGVGFTVNGRIVAEGTETERITFTRSGTSGTWGRLTLNQSSGTRQQQRFVYCDISYAGGGSPVNADDTDVYLDHVRFTNVNVQMVDMVNTSCDLLFCEFNSISSGELIHFSTMPSNGHALIKGCRFGTPGTLASGGYNDIVDFTGGNRPGPIVQFLDNIFVSGVDDCFDMDSCDAHIEGNVFLNIRKDASRSSSCNCITTGAEGSGRAELVICRNLFYNIEHAFMEKDEGTAILQNNTIVRVTPNPLSDNTGAGGDEASGIIMFGEPWRGFPYGAGVHYEGNIGADLQVTDPFPLYSEALADKAAFFVRKRNCTQGFTVPGTANISANPLLVDLTNVTWDNIREKLALQAGSPCRGTGPNGLDMGALVPAGASMSGEPSGVTPSRDAMLTIAGPGIWAYKWRLNGGAWSNEISLVSAAAWNGQRLTANMFDGAPGVTLTNLADGSYTVEVLGKNSAGAWQETPTVSKTWTVQTSPADTDNDGMPDTWESAHGLDAQDAADATGDMDGDGSMNRDEFIAGTDPQDRESRLRATGTVLLDGTASLTIAVVSGKTYRVEASEDLGSWSAVTDLPAQPATGDVTVNDPAAASLHRRFYRVSTPAP